MTDPLPCKCGNAPVYVFVIKGTARRDAGQMVCARAKAGCGLEGPEVGIVEGKTEERAVWAWNAWRQKAAIGRTMANHTRSYVALT